MKHKNITIHIIDDDPGMLTYISELIQGANYTSKTYNNADDFLKSYIDEGLGCLILDMYLPGINGLELHQKLIQKNITLPVIMISGSGDIPTAVQAMKAGVLDFLEKPFQNNKLLELVNNAVSKHKIDRVKNQIKNKTLKCISSLTHREKQVMDLVVIGSLNKDIAKQLGISIKTVEAHRSNVMDKMAVSSIAELVRKSLEVQDLY